MAGAALRLRERDLAARLRVGQRRPRVHVVGRGSPDDVRLDCIIEGVDARAAHALGDGVGHEVAERRELRRPVVVSRLDQAATDEGQGLARAVGELPDVAVVVALEVAGCVRDVGLVGADLAARGVEEGPAAEHLIHSPHPDWQQSLNNATREGEQVRQQLPDGVRRATEGYWNRPTVVTLIVLTLGTVIGLLFFRGYTRQQWGLDPSELDKAVTARVPTRNSTDDRYFTDMTKTYGGNVLTGMGTFRLAYKNKPLKDRQNYVLTRHADPEVDQYPIANLSFVAPEFAGNRPLRYEQSLLTTRLVSIR